MDDFKEQVEAKLDRMASQIPLAENVHFQERFLHFIKQ